jgi:hypothetical protein
MIAEWREQLEATKDDSRALRQSTAYASLRQHLPKDLVQKLESDQRIMHKGGRYGGLSYFPLRALDEIAKLERKWKLV